MMEHAPLYLRVANWRGWMSLLAATRFWFVVRELGGRGGFWGLDKESQRHKANPKLTTEDTEDTGENLKSTSPLKPTEGLNGAPRG